jgi:hypothetical protein
MSIQTINNFVLSEFEWNIICLKYWFFEIMLYVCLFEYCYVSLFKYYYVVLFKYCYARLFEFDYD